MEMYLALLRNFRIQTQNLDVNELHIINLENVEIPRRQQCIIRAVTAKVTY